MPVKRGNTITGVASACYSKVSALPSPRQLGSGVVFQLAPTSFPAVLQESNMSQTGGAADLELAAIMAEVTLRAAAVVASSCAVAGQIDLFELSKCQCPSLCRLEN
jgi:hypothetical protein